VTIIAFCQIVLLKIYLSIYLSQTLPLSWPQDVIQQITFRLIEDHVSQFVAEISCGCFLIPPSDVRRWNENAGGRTQWDISVSLPCSGLHAWMKADGTLAGISARYVDR